MTAVQPEAAIFGERLRNLREKQELSLRSLADLAGMSYTYISDMERGLRVPSLTTIIRLAVALDCKVTDLVGCSTRRTFDRFCRSDDGVMAR